MTVAELKEQPKNQSKEFSAILLVKSYATRQTKTGSDFTIVDLGDNTGSFQVCCFENTQESIAFANIPEGSIVSVEGVIAYYQNRFSPKLKQVDVLTEEQAGSAMDQLVMKSPLDANASWREIEEYIAAIEYEGLRHTVEYAMKSHGEAFRTWPAAISMHHAYRHGLMEHTLRMCRAAKALLPLYPEVNADLAMAGIILHDLGKIPEYTGSLTTRRSRAGILQGHVVLGYRIARKAAIQAKLDEDTRERLEHVILSHQGELEWGAAAMAATPEAVFVSMVDNLDAKMGMVQHALRTNPASAEFSERLPGLGTSLLLTPTMQDAEKKKGQDVPDMDPFQSEVNLFPDEP